MEHGGGRARGLSKPEKSGSAEELASKLGANEVGTFTQAVMHVPVATVDAAAALARALSADCTVAIGGGSPIGLAKALSLRLDLPSLVVPTTSAGSEVPPLWGLTQDGVKTTDRNRFGEGKSVYGRVDLGGRRT